MKIEILLTIAGLFLSLCVNLCAIAFFAGKLKAQSEFFEKTLKDMKENFANNVKEIKENFAEKLRELKENFSEKIAENAKHFEEHIGRLETKQDKHNSTIERTFLLEKQQGVFSEQMKVVNHRIEDIEIKLN